MLPEMALAAEVDAAPDKTMAADLLALLTASEGGVGVAGGEEEAFIPVSACCLPAPSLLWRARCRAVPTTPAAAAPTNIAAHTTTLATATPLPTTTTPPATNTTIAAI